jgi:hypothetical protein
LTTRRRERKGALDQLRELRDRLARGFGDAEVDAPDALVSCKFVAGELAKIIRRIEADIRKAH